MDETNIFVVLASALLSLLFFYVPGFKTWYGKQSEETKQLVMVGAIFVIVAGDYALQLYQKTVVFGLDSALSALTLFVVALAVNAGVYRSVRYIGSDKKAQG